MSLDRYCCLISGSEKLIRGKMKVGGEEEEESADDEKKKTKN